MSADDEVMTELHALRKEVAVLRMNRRSALSKVAAVAATVFGGSALLEQPARADTPSPLELATDNIAGQATTLEVSSDRTGLVAFQVTDGSPDPGPYSAALAGFSDFNVGVYGLSASGPPGAFSGGSGLVLDSMTPTFTATAQLEPSTGQTGQYLLDSEKAQLRACIVPGDGGLWANIGFNPSGPGRAMDSRVGTGTAKARLVSNSARTITILGVAAVPDSSSIRAVAYAITVNNPSSAGFLKLGPTGGSTATVVNYTKGVSISGSGITGLSSDGKIDVTIEGGTADVIIDITGYVV